MKKLLPLFVLAATLHAQVFQETNGLVVLEAEQTASTLGQWQELSTVNGYTGTGYLEFFGNNPASGPASSPIEFQFQINQSGLYYLHLHCARETLVLNGETRTDVANDCYVRVEGNYNAGPSPGNTHGSQAQLSTLQSNTKFYGGSNLAFSWATGNRLDLGGHNNKRVAVYNFQAGETYTLVVSGRSQKFKLNRIVFRKSGVPTNTAQNLNLAASPTNQNISGELKKWHKITFSFEGPNTAETATPNPFLDYRFDLTFTHTASNKTYIVPGYYAADGNSANSSATSGNIWMCHFTPDEIGNWNYTASFRTGSHVAVSSAETPGTSAGYFDGESGTFTISPTDKTGRDFRAKGRLQYVNKHHLQFAETGEYFLKAGPDAPENILAYNDFDATPNDPNGNSNLLKTWRAHEDDYNATEAAAFTWKSGKGTELLGALHYLASEGLNAFSFLTFNVDGDDDNVFPHLLVNGTAPYEAKGDNQRWNANPAVLYKTRFDISKMAQWERIFEYAQQKGLYLHFKTQETENDDRMDGGALGHERKLYYRELIARFAHHLALNWNLGEENTNSTAERIAFAQWFRDLDPYQHNRVIHSYPGQKNQVYTPLLGSASTYTGASLQTNNTDFIHVFADTLTWVTQSANAGKPWVVACDEPGDAQRALRPDNDAGNSHTDGRINALWGNIMAGGAGCEFYFGYGHAHSDLTCQDFRSRDNFWDYCRYALSFFQDNNIPFQELSNTNSLISSSGNNGNRCLSKTGMAYVVQLVNGGSHTLDLSGEPNASFQVQWFNPRTGGSLIPGTIVNGGQTVPLGNPPHTNNSDWIALVSVADPDANAAPSVQAGNNRSTALSNNQATLLIQGQVSDDGRPLQQTLSYSWSKVSGPGTVTFGDRTRLTTPVTFDQIGTYVLRLTADDTERTAFDELTINVTSLASGTTNLTPIDDAYTQNGVNFNNSGLRIESTPNRTRLSYLKFDTTAVAGTYSAATLQLTEGSDISSGTMTLRFFQCTSNNWTESNLASSNAPTKGDQIALITDNVTDGEVINIDVHSFIHAPGVYSILIEADASNLDLEFSSSEGPNPPLLIIENTVEPPQAQLISPPHESVFSSADTIRFEAQSMTPNGNFTSIELYLNGLSLGNSLEKIWTSPPLPKGTYHVSLIAEDSNGLTASDSMRFEVRSSTDPRVQLSIQRIPNSTQLQCIWDNNNKILEGSPDLQDPWTEIPGSSPVTITPLPEHDSYFYRLKNKVP
ncbi:MAG: DUF5060 domain-containing protein [Coraliomargaritaceae bacterium]